MTEEEKAEIWAYTRVKNRMAGGKIPADAGTLEIAEISYATGAQEERARIIETLYTYIDGHGGKPLSMAEITRLTLPTPKDAKV